MVNRLKIQMSIPRHDVQAHAHRLDNDSEKAPATADSVGLWRHNAEVGHVSVALPPQRLGLELHRRLHWRGRRSADPEQETRQ